MNSKPLLKKTIPLKKTVPVIKSKTMRKPGMKMPVMKMIAKRIEAPRKWMITQVVLTRLIAV